ncbi:hypothetical protein [Paraburkholderia sp.]|uniref:hypothetical protein n=1 Tax=Paraburkholderia sp. TaxID=1926495 RepID=UPI00238A0EFE|nr:hypothetical protein [Paraburkholderia sp.]MDE1179278.1 hypothetical protein [Paraburkholderia sp.]
MTPEILQQSQAPISADLAAILNVLSQEQSAHLTFAKPFINAAIANEHLIASSVLMLSARAAGAASDDDRDAPTLHAFAAAMELMVLSLEAHARLGNQRSGDAAQAQNEGEGEVSSPLLSLGTPAGVLLGDVLYTRAFQIVVKTGHAPGLTEIARATERMVTAAAREHIATTAGTHPAPDDPARVNPFRREAYAACCRLAAVLTPVTQDQHALLFSLADRMTGSVQLESALPDTSVLRDCFAPSMYRDALSGLLASLV